MTPQETVSKNKNENSIDIKKSAMGKYMYEMYEQKTWSNLTQLFAFSNSILQKQPF